MHVVYLPLSLSTLGFETGSLTGCGVHQSVWISGPQGCAHLLWAEIADAQHYAEFDMGPENPNSALQTCTMNTCLVETISPDPRP